MADFRRPINHRPLVQTIAPEKCRPTLAGSEHLHKPGERFPALRLQGTGGRGYAFWRLRISRVAQKLICRGPGERYAYPWMPPPKQTRAEAIIAKKEIIDRVLFALRCAVQVRTDPVRHPVFMSAPFQEPLRLA